MKAKNHWNFHLKQSNFSLEIMKREVIRMGRVIRINGQSNNLVLFRLPSINIGISTLNIFLYSEPVVANGISIKRS